MTSIVTKYRVAKLSNIHSPHQLPEQRANSHGMVLRSLEQEPRARLTTHELELFPLLDEEAAQFKVGQIVTVTISSD